MQQILLQIKVSEVCMAKMLLSIRPEFVKKIFDGTKVFEYRKTCCKRDINTILIYETSPTMKVVGEARIEFIFFNSPEKVWKETHKGSGLTKEFFDSYFRGKDTAVAYKLSNVIKYDNAVPLSEFGIARAPQSFCYI